MVEEEYRSTYSPKRFLYRYRLPLLFRLASLATFPKGEGFSPLGISFGHNKRMRANRRGPKKSGVCNNEDPLEAAESNRKHDKVHQ